MSRERSWHSQLQDHEGVIILGKKITLPNEFYCAVSCVREKIDQVKGLTFVFGSDQVSQEDVTVANSATLVEVREFSHFYHEKSGFLAFSDTVCELSQRTAFLVADNASSSECSIKSKCRQTKPG